MLFGKYTMGSLIIELLSYFVLAGIGMYSLCNHLYKNNAIAFIIGLSYSLSGMMVGSAQLMIFVAGIAWLPWCLLTLIRFYQTLQAKHMLLSALFFAMNTVSASPAYTIVLVYIYIGIFSFIFWENRKVIPNIKKIILSGVAFCITSLVLLLPYINAFIEFSPYFNRLTKLPYQGFLLSNPFSLTDYLSFLFPYSVISASKIFDATDLSLRNGYIGLAGLFGVVLALIYVRNKRMFFLGLGILFFLLLAAGNATFFYKIAYHLPGFGVFRHPSFFKSYALFLLLIVAGYGWLQVIKKEALNKAEKTVIFGFCSIFVMASGVAFVKTSPNEIIENITNVLNYVEFSKHLLSTHVFINSVLILFIVSLVFLLKKTLGFSIITTLLIFTFLDVGIQTQLTFPTTISHNIPFSNFKTYFKQLPNEINQKDNHQPLKYFDETQGLFSTKGIWKNMSTFNKTISYVGYNPFNFASFDAANKNNVLNLNIQNPIIFAPTKVFEQGDSTQQGLIWNTPKMVQFSEQPLLIKNIVVDYNSFRAEVVNGSKNAQWLVLNQNYHHLWKATYESKNIPILFVNELVMGVEIPKNSSGKILFSFESPRTIYLTLLSVLGYFFIGFYFIFSKKQTY